MNILIIEDEQAIASIYKRIIDGAGHSSAIASTPEQAIALASDKRFDLAFIDLMLPEMNGSDLLEKMRLNKIFKDTPVVITTNMGSGYDVQRLMALDVKEILLKVKAGPEEILECISKYT